MNSYNIAVCLSAYLAHDPMARKATQTLQASNALLLPSFHSQKKATRWHNLLESENYSRTIRFRVGHWQVPLSFPHFLPQRPQICSWGSWRRRGLSCPTISPLRSFPIYIYWKSARLSSASPPLTVISIQEALLYSTLNPLARTTTLNLHS